MNAPRLQQTILAASLALGSWWTMMLAHELGHVITAWTTGGVVLQVVWHPLVLSRTDVSPNPSPLMVVWGGPVIGCVLPLALLGITRKTRKNLSYLAEFFAGFCLIANGVYLGAGMWDRIGDPGEMLRLGCPGWVLIVFACLTVLPGFWLLHRSSRSLGFGQPRRRVDPTHAYGCLVATVVLALVGFLLGHRG